MHTETLIVTITLIQTFLWIFEMFDLTFICHFELGHVNCDDAWDVFCLGFHIWIWAYHTEERGSSTPSRVKGRWGKDQREFKHKEGVKASRTERGWGKEIPESSDKLWVLYRLHYHVTNIFSDPFGVLWFQAEGRRWSDVPINAVFNMLISASGGVPAMACTSLTKAFLRGQALSS